MDVRGTTGIVTGEYSLKSDNTITATFLDTTQKGGVQVCSVITVAVPTSDNTRVNTLQEELVRIDQEEQLILLLIFHLQ